MNSPSFSKKVTGAVVLVVASTIFGALVCLLVDFLVLSPLLVDPDTDIIEIHREGWYTLRPNLNGSNSWGHSYYAVRTDENGFRISDEASGGVTGTSKFIFLGDSFVFGVNGPWAETFVGMFEKHFGAGVINAGMWSYSPTAYIYQYQRALAANVLHPSHIVIVALDISDVQDEAAVWDDGYEHPRWRARMEIETRRMKHTSESSRLRKFLNSRFLASKIIYRLLRYKLIKRKAQVNAYTFDQIRSAFTWRPWTEIEGGVLQEPNEAIYERLGYGALGVAGGLARIREKMHVLSDIVRQNGSQLWILIYPWPAQLKYGQPVFNWENFNRDLCAEIACDGFINTFPLFRAEARNHSDWYSKYFVVGDVHFNKRGNQLIADALINALRRVAPK